MLMRFLCVIRMRYLWLPLGSGASECGSAATTIALSTSLVNNCMDRYYLCVISRNKTLLLLIHPRLVVHMGQEGRQWESSARATNSINLVCKWRNISPAKSGCGSSA